MEKEGGLACMFSELLRMDLKGWHPRQDVPKTDLFHEQVAMSLGAEAMFWKEILEDGALPEHWLCVGTNDRWREGHSVTIYRAAVMESFYSQNPGARRSLQNSKMGRLLSRVGTLNFQPRDGNERPRCWVIPGLTSQLWAKIG